MNKELPCNVILGCPPRLQVCCAQCGLYILVMLIEKMFITLLVLFKFWGKVITSTCTCVQRLPSGSVCKLSNIYMFDFE